MTDTLAELQRLATEAADEAEGDWFDRDLIESNEPILSTRKARRFIAAANPALILRLVRIAQAAETVCNASAVQESGDPYWIRLYGSIAALREALGEKQA